MLANIIIGRNKYYILLACTTRR